MRRRSLLLAAGAAACSPGKPAALAPLRFSVLSTETSSAQSVKWEPFLRALSEKLGREVKPFFASAYAPLIEAMRFGQTDAGWFSNQSGLEAVRRGGGEVFARTTHPDGSRGYRSIIVARKGSGITLDRVLKCDRTLDFGMGDAKSTSGTLAPRAWLFAPRGLDPATCFKTIRSASHEANLLAVANGVVAASTNNTNDLERLARRHDPTAQSVLDRIEILWTSEPLPEDPVVRRKGLDEETRRKLAEVLIGFGGAPGGAGETERALLTNLNFGRFQPADDRHLLPVRELEAVDLLQTARRRGDAAAMAAEEAELARIRAERAKA